MSQDFNLENFLVNLYPGLSFRNVDPYLQHLIVAFKISVGGLGECEMFFMCMFSHQASSERAEISDMPLEN